MTKTMSYVEDIQDIVNLRRTRRKVSVALGTAFMVISDLRYHGKVDQTIDNIFAELGKIDRRARDEIDFKIRNEPHSVITREMVGNLAARTGSLIDELDTYLDFNNIHHDIDLVKV